MTSHIRARKDARILYPSRPEERKKKPRFLAAIMDPAALEPAGEDEAKYCVLLYDDDKDDEKPECLQLYMNDKLSSVGECDSKGPRWFSLGSGRPHIPSAWQHPKHDFLLVFMKLAASQVKTPRTRLPREPLCKVGSSLATELGGGGGGGIPRISLHHADKHHTCPLDHLLIRSEHILHALVRKH